MGGGLQLNFHKHISFWVKVLQSFSQANAMPETLQIIITFNDNKFARKCQLFFQKNLLIAKLCLVHRTLLRKSNERCSERWVSVFIEMKPSHPPAT